MHYFVQLRPPTPPGRERENKRKTIQGMFQLRVNNEERNSFRFGCIESNVLIRRLFISCRRCCRRSCFRSRCRPSHRSRRCRRRCRCPAPIQTKSWDCFQLKIPQFGGFINFPVVLKTEKM